MPHHKPAIPHYADSQIQPIDFIEANFSPDEYCGYLKGNVIKYIARYQHKGCALEDLSKASVYLDWLIEHETKRAVKRDVSGGSS